MESNTNISVKKEAIEEYKRYRESYIQMIVERERQAEEISKLFSNDKKAEKAR